MQPKRIILPLALLLLLSALLFLPTEQRPGLDFVQTMEPSEDAVFVTPKQNPIRNDKKNVVLNQTPTSLPRTSSWESLAQALNKGQPITILNPNGNSETYWMRPRLAVSEDFQVTIGKARDNKLHVKPMVYEGYHFPEHPSGNPSTITSGIRAFFTIVGNSFALKPDCLNNDYGPCLKSPTPAEWTHAKELQPSPQPIQQSSPNIILQRLWK
jgi:hypothetical protein